MKRISFFWKHDSSANNGYRQLARMYLEGCIIDDVIIPDSLVKWLGKPFEIKNYENEVDYKYYFYNYYTSDTLRYNGPFGADYTLFIFIKSNLQLRKIGHGTIEY
jgi:hypothetical protein